MTQQLAPLDPRAHPVAHPPDADGGPQPARAHALDRRGAAARWGLTGTTKRELKADRSLMETVQLPESEVAELARRTRPASPSSGRTDA